MGTGHRLFMQVQRDPGGFWDEVYTSSPELFGNEPSEFARRCLNIFRDRDLHLVLDIGCGYGRDAYFFSRHAFSIVALDCSLIACKTLRDPQKKDQYDRSSPLFGIICTDLRRPLPFRSETFDGVYANLVLHQDFTPPEREAIYSELRRVLKHSGLLAATMRSIKDPLYGKGECVGEQHYFYRGQGRFFYSQADVMNHLQGFRILVLEECSLTIPDLPSLEYLTVIAERKGW